MSKIWDFFTDKKKNKTKPKITVIDQNLNKQIKITENSTRYRTDEPTTHKNQYVAFDHEIAKIIEGDFSLWHQHRPLGIICSASYIEGKEPLVHYGFDTNGNPLPNMSKQQSQDLVYELMTLVNEGYTILTWNGLGFDFDVLAEESGLWEECKELALNHVDMMFHFFCVKGYPLKLDKAAKGMGLHGKLDGVTGDQAPLLWRQGHYDTVLDYVEQDAVTTMEVARVVEKRGYISWISNSGNRQIVEFPRGWLTVREALQLSLPDTSWMDNPLRRLDFYDWTQTNPSVNNRTVYQEKTKSWRATREPIKPQYNKQGVELDFSEIEDKLEHEQIQELIKENRDGCPCPICRGDPGADHVFRLLFCINRSDSYDDYWDYYDEDEEN